MPSRFLIKLTSRLFDSLLQDTRAELDRVRLASSGSAKDTAALQAQLSDELASLKFASLECS